MPSYDEELIEKGLQRGLQQGLEQGLERGLEQGREEGRRHGLRDGLLSILRGRFGPLEMRDESRVAGASVGDLESWLQRAIAAERIEDVFAE
jgi:hypothetical protein